MLSVIRVHNVINQQNQIGNTCVAAIGVARRLTMVDCCTSSPGHVIADGFNLIDTAASPHPARKLGIGRYGNNTRQCRPELN